MTVELKWKRKKKKGNKEHTHQRSIGRHQKGEVCTSPNDDKTSHIQSAGRLDDSTNIRLRSNFTRNFPSRIQHIVAKDYKDYYERPPKKKEEKKEVMIAGYCTWTTPIEQHGNTKAKLTLHQVSP